MISKNIFNLIIFILYIFNGIMHPSIPAATIPPPAPPPGIGKFSFFFVQMPRGRAKKRNNAPPLGRKTKQMPHPRADKLVNSKECTKLITCVLTICIYTSVNCSFGNLQKNKQGKLSCSFQMKTSTKGCDTSHTCFYCRKFFIVNTIYIIWTEGKS